MNKLSREKQIAVIFGFTEGLGVRAVERLTGVHRDSALRLLVRVGEACAKLMDERMRDLPCERLELDEQWSLVAKKQRRLKPHDDQTKKGDFWIWTSICATTRAVPNFHLGKRTAADAKSFVCDLSSRLRNRVQISTDGLGLYVEAIEAGFGHEVDYGRIVKSFEGEAIGAGRYSPPRVVSTEKSVIVGEPDRAKISTSYIERLHLLNRMRCRRLTRLVDGFSRKVDNLLAALRVHYTTYNFVKRHRALDGATPAMALGVSDRLWEVSDLVDLAGWGRSTVSDRT
jgi:IS1 family transposase